MRALILKEIREGGNIVLFGGVLSVLVLGAYAFLTLLKEDGIGFSNALLLILPPVLGVVAGSVLFAREKTAGTLPLLLALPLSRGRIWWAKVIGGAVLAAGSALFFAIPVLIAVPRLPESFSAIPYLPYSAAAVVLGFTLATLCSTLAERSFSALLVGILGLGALVLGALYVVGGMGGGIVAHEWLDATIWWSLAVGPMLLGSAMALRYGELLFRKRKWMVGVPAAVVSFALLFAVMVGVVRVATRYQRSKVSALHPATMTSSAPVMAVTALGPITKVGQKERRGQDLGWSSEFRRSSHLVLLSAETGKEVLVRRTAENWNEQVAVSPDGRYAAIIGPPEPLTWASETPNGERRLSVWDLKQRRLVYRGWPQREAEGPPEFKYAFPDFSNGMAWSPDGEWLAVGLTGGPSFLVLMRPDGSEMRAVPAAVRDQFDPFTLDFAWGPSGEEMYYLGEDRCLMRWTVSGESPEVVWRPGDPPTRDSYWSRGAVAVSPEGRRIAVALLSSVWSEKGTKAAAGRRSSRQVAIVSSDGSESTVVWRRDDPASLVSCT